ncbi:MAG: GNAT family N-acetyltransferase [Clostridia bacterium]|nr:GNAT family N-acetyltransferase [Clostridia bacterium]
MYLITERCILRRFSLSDAEDLHSVLSDEEVMRYIEPVFDMDRTTTFIREAGLCKPPLVYAVLWRETESIIGHVVFHRYDDSGYEIGWVLNRSFWGMGIADELTKALVKKARDMGIESCIIECDVRQAASIRLALKNGFVFESVQEELAVYRLKFV